jgi:hypothetical protein
MALSSLMVEFGSANAFPNSPWPSAFGIETTTPVAVCGRRCEYGGRYIPGPPDLCYDYGLNYCGPSRRRPAPSVVVPIPGVGGVGIYAPGARPGYGGGGCRRVTIERDDGSVRRIRRCD